jgi:hypothetical protein
MNLDLSFGNTKIYNDQVLNTDISQLPFNVTLHVENDQLSTLIVYDLSAPSVNSPVYSPFLHFLEVNIPDSRIDLGDVLMKYTPPNPPTNSGKHVYVVDLFRQTYKILPAISDRRESFPVMQFVQTYNLNHESRLIFRVDSGDPKSPRYDGEWTQGLDEGYSKYCDCVIEVAAKQPASCNSERAWYQTRENRRCYSPHAVCHSTVKNSKGHGTPACTESYVFENIPDDKLVGYSSLHRIDIPQPYNREQMLQNIHSHIDELAGKKEKFEQDIASGTYKVFQ